VSELELRRRPTQARSAATFDHILDTATVLLEDVGWDGFTTNLLAERGGIGVQTLYRYFPNKLSVVATLAERKIEEWDSWFENIVDLLDPEGTDWGRGVLICLDGLRNQPGGIAIRRAMGASPALRELDREDNVRIAHRFAEAIAAADPSVDPEQAAIALRVTLEAVMAVLDVTYDMTKADADAHVDACVAMQAAYLEQCFPNFGGKRR